MKLASLTTFLLVAGTSLLSIAAQNCPNGVIPRKEIRDLSDDEFKRLIRAIKALHDKPSELYDGYSQYEEFGILHDRYSDVAHGTTEFFLWHRAFLHSFEKKLRDVDPKVRLAYWDWSNQEDAYAPEKSVIWKLIGSSDGKGGCIPSGPFKNFQIKYPDSHCICRSFNPKKNTKRFYDNRVLGELVRKEKKFSVFAQKFEKSAHAQPHNLIGGGSCDMSSMSSPNDPVFFFHHSFVDKMVWDWQNTHDKSMKTYSGTSNSKSGKASLKNVFAPFKVTASSVVNVQDLCYTYQQPIRAGPKPINSPSTETTPNKSTLAKRHFEQYTKVPMNLDYEPDTSIPESAYRFKVGDQWFKIPPVPKNLRPVVQASRTFMKMNGWDVKMAEKTIKNFNNYDCDIYNKMRKGIAMTPPGYEAGYKADKCTKAPYKKPEKKECSDCEVKNETFADKVVTKVIKACKDSLDKVNSVLNLKKSY